jgi:phage-related tail fiber protein
MAEPSTYYTVVTDIGRALETNAQSLGDGVTLTHMAIGDGGGADVTPDPAASALVNEVHRVALHRIYVHETEPTWLVIEAIVPADVGGWTVREVGVIAAGGLLYAHGNFPATVKPVLADGSSKDLIIRVVVERTAQSAVTLMVDPAVILASQAWVMAVLPDPVGYATTEQAGIVELATPAEAVAGTDTERAVTPEGLAAHVTDRMGAIRADLYWWGQL